MEYAREHTEGNRELISPTTLCEIGMRPNPVRFQLTMACGRAVVSSACLLSIAGLVSNGLSAQTPAPPLRLTLSAPGAVPSLFGRGIISTSFDEWNTSFTPDGRTVFFSRGRFWTIMTSTRTRNSWSTPEVAAFSGRWLDTDPFVSPDGRRVYFVSNRPLNSTPGTKPLPYFSIWYVERTAMRTWSRPINVGTPINGHGSAWFPSVTSDGTLYFHARRDGGKGGSDIYYSRRMGDHYAEPVPVDFNTAASEQEPYVAPDESYMIFVSDRAGGFGAGDLYVSIRRNGHWGEPMNLGPQINTYATEMAPSVSSDGATLYFTGSRRSFRDARPSRVDGAAFMRELSGYENGSLKMYSIALDTAALRHLKQDQVATTPKN